MRFNTLEDMHKLAKRQLRPLYAFFEITYKCNLRCIHCYNNFSHKGREMSFQEITVALNQLADAGTLFIDFSGGEPLIREDFIDIARYARKLGFAVTILTNATLVTKDLADKIAQLCPRRIKITLYGSSEETFKKVTGKPALFYKAIEGIRLLSKRSLPIIVASPIFNFYTIDDVLTMQKICNDLGVRWWPPTKFYIRNDGNREPLKYILSESQFKEFSKKIVKMSRGRPINKNFKMNKEDRVCGNLRCNIFINPYGQIGNCNMLISKDSFRERPILDIWKNDSLLKNQREVRRKDLIQCIKCKSFFYCRPCLATNFLSTGSFYKIPASFCQFAHTLNEVNESECLIQNSKAIKRISDEENPQTCQ